MMAATTLDQHIVIPAMRVLSLFMAGRDLATQPARKMMVAIAVQESGLRHRRQVRGPARGLWQFERIACEEMLRRYPAITTDLCRELLFERHVDVIYGSLADSDMLAACFARLLLWSDPRPLPGRGDEEAAWNYYIRNWRSGKPHRNRWTTSWKIADLAVYPELVAG